MDPWAAAAVDRLQLELDVVKAAWGVINITVAGQGGARVLRWSLSGKVAETALPAGVSACVEWGGGGWGVGR